MNAIFVHSRKSTPVKYALFYVLRFPFYVLRVACYVVLCCVQVERKTTKLNQKSATNLKTQNETEEQQQRTQTKTQHVKRQITVRYPSDKRLSDCYLMVICWCCVLRVLKEKENLRSTLRLRFS